jgi:hypothetical protein
MASALHTLARHDDFEMIGLPLDSKVTAVIGRVPIAIALAIELVMTSLVGHEIAQSEAIVGSEIRHRFGRAAMGSLKNIGRGAKTPRKLATRHMTAQPKPAHVIAESIVPLQPTLRESPQLVSRHAHVPRFGDQQYRRQHRIL